MSYKLVCEIITGSKLYGIADEFSDFDYVGVCIAPLSIYLGQQGFDQFNSVMGQDIVNYKHQPYNFAAILEADRTIYSINKAVKLCLDNNPNMLDLLYAPEEFWQYMSEEWRYFIEHRDLFLSKKAKFTFCGYAYSQLKRLKNHKRWIDDPPTKPERKASLPDKKWYTDNIFNNLVDNFKNFIADELVGQLIGHELLQGDAGWLRSQVGKFIAEIPVVFFRNYTVRFFQSVANKFIREEYQEILRDEFDYNMQIKDWRAYQAWLKHRNPERFKFEKNFGYDVKHGGHLVRLLLMGEEALSKGTITLPLRPEDREIVKAVRAGAYSFDWLTEFAKNKEDSLNALYKTSSLQHKPNRKLVEKKLIETLFKHFVLDA